MAKVLRSVSVLALASSLGLLWLRAGGPDHGDGPRARLLEGTVLLSEGRWADALDPLRLAVAADDPSVRVVAHHNLGLALLRLAENEEGNQALGWATQAVGHQEKALDIEPGLKPAAWNLELALERIRALEETGSRSEAEESSRLLVSFRLQEEEALSERLPQGLGPTGSPGGTVRRKGPPW